MKKTQITKASELNKGILFTDEKGTKCYQVKDITTTPSTGITYVETKDGTVINVDKALAGGGLFRLKK